MAIKEITDRIDDIKFDMVTMRFDESQKLNEKIGNVNVYRVGTGARYLDKILFIPRAVSTANRLIKQNKYDKMWAIMTYMLFPISIMRIFWGNKIPYVLTLQDGDPFSRVFKRIRILAFLPLLKYGFKHAEKVQTISTFLAGWTTKMGFSGSPVVIPNGVDTKLFSKEFSVEEIVSTRNSMGADEKNIIIFSASRLTHKNGLDLVIRAMSDLPGNYIFAVAGIGEEEKNLKDLVKKLKLEERVKFLGFISHERLVQHLKASDVFIRASRSEGMGNSFIEAMVAGVPVIGTPVGGITDFLKDNETGFLCEPENPRSIADDVQKVINLPMSQKKLVINNARKLAIERYDWSLISQKMAQILY